MDKCEIYKLSCKTCKNFYIGKTERTFKIRLREHESLINPKHLSNAQNLRIKSIFAFHVLTSGHDINSYKKDFLHICYKRNTIDNLQQLEILNAKHQHPDLIINDVVNFNNIVLTDKLVKCNVFARV